MTSSTTSAQTSNLMKYMEKCPTMATNSPGDSPGRGCCNKRWEALCEKLYVNGPPVKNIKGWKKTWADYKHQAKKKLAANKQSLKETGGGPFKEKKLTAFEEAVADLAKIKAAVYGISDVKTFCGERDIKKSPPSSSIGKQTAGDIESVLKDLLSSNDDSDSDTSIDNNGSAVLILPSNK